VTSGARLLGLRSGDVHSLAAPAVVRALAGAALPVALAAASPDVPALLLDGGGLSLAYNRPRVLTPHLSCLM
jgi:hypothetical protein